MSFAAREKERQAAEVALLARLRDASTIVRPLPAVDERILSRNASRPAPLTMTREAFSTAAMSRGLGS